MEQVYRKRVWVALLALCLVVSGSTLLAPRSDAQTTVSCNRRYAPNNGDPDDTQGGDSSDGVMRTWRMSPGKKATAVDRNRVQYWLQVAIQGTRSLWFRI